MNYYQTSKKASSQIGSHPGLIYLQNLCQSSQKILDVGCGEGTRLDTLLPKGIKGWGIDPNEKAIAKAKKQYSRHYFKIGTGESLPYPDNQFDLVYSVFAIEHCVSPTQFITQMIRVTKPKGHLVILAPNYGAPNRRSPNSAESPLNKFAESFIKDFFPSPALDWRQVTPQKTYKQIDADTTWEPYLYSLYLYFKTQKLDIEKFSSLWELEPKSSNLRKKMFRILGGLDIRPFSMWGPQLFIVAVK